MLAACFSKPTAGQFSGLRSDISALNELKQIPHWVAWRYEERNGKPTKPPINPHTGGHAKANEAHTWGSYEQSERRARKGGLSGVGFVLTAGDNLTGYDLDKCRNPITGKIKPWAQNILDYDETYAEVSPSGRGLRLIARGKATPVKYDPAHVEMYVDGRYLTITGQWIEGTPNTIGEAERTRVACQERVELHQSTWHALKKAGPNITPDVLTGKAQVSKCGAEIIDWPHFKDASPRIASESRDGSAFWYNVNSAALQNLQAWVPALFGAAAEVRSGSIGGYRVSSHALRRNLEEDLSITPQGIKDFGVHDLDDPKGGKRSCIDLVLEHRDLLEIEIPSFKEAAFWLCEQMGISPENLGWRARYDRGIKATAAAELVAVDQEAFILNRGKRSSTSQDNIRLALNLLNVQLRHDVFQDRLTIIGLEACGPLLDDRSMTRLWLTVDAALVFDPRANSSGR